MDDLRGERQDETIGLEVEQSQCIRMPRDGENKWKTGLHQSAEMATKCHLSHGSFQVKAVRSQGD